MWTSLTYSFFLALFSLLNLFGIKPQLLGNQLVYFGIALVSFFAARKLGWHFFKRNAKFFYWLSILLLLVTYIIGIEVKGSKRWIDLYFFNFQSSEIFKIFFIAFLADFFSRHRKNLDQTSVFLKSLGYFILPTFIILKQPDLANALVYAFIFLVILFFSNTPKKIILYSIFTLVLLMPVFWLGFKGYQKERVTSFFSSHIDTSGSGYNMIQAMISVGSGKFLGRGLGYGTQSRLLFLPENHTDFAFSSLIEQFGFFGGFCLLLLYLLLIGSLVKKIIEFQKQTDEESNFKFLLTLGFLSYFFFHVFVNIGMNLGLLPVAGIVLPLISYGGSAAVGFMIGLGMLP